jgi:thioredoxin 1
MVKDVSPDEIEDVASKAKVLFVDCWAPWCGPCLALAPIMEELEKKYSDNDDVQFLKVNTQNYRQFAVDNDIRAIPCVLIYSHGKLAHVEVPDPRTGKATETDRLIGLRPPEHYEEVIKELLK